MSMDELMKLVNAGFTKTEILAITGNTPTETATESTVIEEKAVEEVKEDEPVIDDIKSEEPKESTPLATNVNFAPMMTDAQIEKLAQMLNRGTATIDLPQPRNIDESLSEHFKNLMLGKE